MAKKIGVNSKGEAAKSAQAAFGIYEKLVITEIPDAASLALLGKQLVSAGSLSVAGDYYCDVDITGVSDLSIVLRTSDQSGTGITPEAWVTLQDGITQRGVAATGFAVLVADTSDEGTLEVPVGARILRVKLTLAASSASTFDVAEIAGR